MVYVDGIVCFFWGNPVACDVASEACDVLSPVKKVYTYKLNGTWIYIGFCIVIDCYKRICTSFSLTLQILQIAIA